MVGEEAVALGAGVAKGIAKAGKTDAVVDGKLLDKASNTESFGGAAEIRARRIAVKEAVLLKLMQPLGRMVGIRRDYFDSGAFLSDITDAMADIPPEHVVEPKASVAGPALAGLAQSLDEAELKEMYLTLIARASDGRMAPKVHVSFALLLGQLAAEEALALQRIASNIDVPVAQLQMRRLVDKKEETSVLLDHLCGVEEFDGTVPEEDLPFYIANWIRLGLVDVQYGRRLKRAGAYDWVSKSPLALEAKKSFLARSEDDGAALIVVGGIMRATNYTNRFAEVVLTSAAHEEQVREQ